MPHPLRMCGQGSGKPPGALFSTSFWTALGLFAPELIPSAPPERNASVLSLFLIHSFFSSIHPVVKVITQQGLENRGGLPGS